MAVLADTAKSENKSALKRQAKAMGQIIALYEVDIEQRNKREMQAKENFSKDRD